MLAQTCHTGKGAVHKRRQQFRAGDGSKFPWNSFSPIGSPIINKYYSTVPKIVHKSVFIIVPKIVLKIVPDRQQNSGLMALVSAS